MELKSKQIELARPINLLEEEEAEKTLQEKRNQVTFTDALSAAYAEDNTMSWIYNGFENFEPDRDFSL